MNLRTNTTPNEGNLLRWVRALESGDYAQGQGRLNEDNEFCCLGVACDVAKDDLGGRWASDPGEIGLQRFLAPGIQGGGETAYLPGVVADWLGLEGEGSIIDPELDGQNATSRNDSGTQNFDHIAAAIRREFDLPTKEQDEHRLKWIEALESGNYEQVGGALRTEAGKYCCLGVACDLAAQDDVGYWDGDAFHTSSQTQDAVLPDAVAIWLGVTSPDPILNEVHATKRNDMNGEDFAAIAAAARIEFGFPPKEA